MVIFMIFTDAPHRQCFRTLEGVFRQNAAMFEGKLDFTSIEKA
jgi:hypothetical protein